jgi:hypothetical protein
MRIVAGQAIANRRLMDVSFNLSRVFVAVAGQAELGGSGRGELYAGDVLVDANLVAGGAAQGYGGMDGLSLGLILVTLNALGGVGVFFEGNRVNSGVSAGD